MLYAIQLVKCLYYGGGFLFFGFLMLHLSIINVYGFGFFFFFQEIDDYIVQAKERGYETMVNFGRQGLNLAATAAVTAAVKVIFYLHFSSNSTLIKSMDKVWCLFISDCYEIWQNSLCLFL